MLLVAAIAAGGVLAAFWGWERVANRRLREELARIRVAPPGASADADESDAAADYLAALRLLHARPRKLDALIRPPDQESLTCPPAAVAPLVAARMARVLARAVPALELLDRGATKPSCHHVFPRNNRVTARAQVRAIRTAARLLTLRALDLARAGDGDGGTRSFVGVVRLLRIFDDDPDLARYSVRLADTGTAIELGVPAILSLGRPSDHALSDLDTALGLADRPELLRDAIVGERAEGVRYWGELLGADWPGEPVGAAGVENPFWTRPWIEVLATGYFRTMAVAARAADDPWPAVLVSMPAMPDGDPGRLLRVTRATGRELTRARAAAIALRVERYRRLHHEPPATLADLGGADDAPRFADPFTGAALSFRVDPDRYLVYGVGPDGEVSGRDDGVEVCLPAPSAG
jgi:hypothetical protein